MKKIISICLTVFTLLSGTVFAQQGGKCGDNLTWELADGVLTISGTGDMYDYETAADVPWYLRKDEVISLSVEGTEKIGTYAFFGCINLKTAVLPETVKHIGSNAFCRCESLTEVTIPCSVKDIGYNAFSYCTSLEKGINSKGDRRNFRFCF